MQRLFIEALARGASVATAAKQAGMSRAGVYKWREDAKLAAAWDDAVDTGLDLLEDVARKRAVKSSDALLMMLLKCRRPEVFNRPPPPTELPVDHVKFKITTVHEAVARVQQLGMRPLQIEGDYDDE
jgi:transposase-like protein